eukprot:CFRG0793T1
MSPPIPLPTGTVNRTLASVQSRESRTSWTFQESPPYPKEDDDRRSYTRNDTVLVAQDTDFYLSDNENLNTNRLKHASTVSALLAGFSMEAYVQMNLDDGLPDSLMILFAVSSTSLIAVNLFALLCSVSLLPTINAYNIVSTRRAKEGIPRMPSRLSPHKRFYTYIVTAWIASVVLGIQLFLFEVIVVTWVHFYIKCKMAAVCVTATIAPAMVLFGFFARHLHLGVVDLQLAPIQNALDRGLEETAFNRPEAFDVLGRMDSTLQTSDGGVRSNKGSARRSTLYVRNQQSPKEREDFSGGSNDFMEFYDADEHSILPNQLTEHSAPSSYSEARVDTFAFENHPSPTLAPLYASRQSQAPLLPLLQPQRVSQRNSQSQPQHRLSVNINAPGHKQPYGQHVHSDDGGVGVSGRVTVPCTSSFDECVGGRNKRNCPPNIRDGNIIPGLRAHAPIQTKASSSTCNRVHDLPSLSPSPPKHL